MNKTPNYQLNQWDKSDRIQMEDFNADNAKLEAALAQETAARAAADTNLQSSMNAAISALETSIANNSLKVKTGTFTGDGTSSTRTFELGVKPKLLILRTNNTRTSSTYAVGAVVTEFACLKINSTGAAYMNESGDPCALTETGFSVVTGSNEYVGFNAPTSTLSYWVLY